MRQQVMGIVALFTIIGALMLVPAATHAAQSSVNHATYLFFVGDGPPPAGQDVSTGPNGFTVTMWGTGSFNAGPKKSVSGGGNYVIANASGATVASGKWTATQMLGFASYGSCSASWCAGFPATWVGGQAEMRVNLDGLGSGVLNIDCVIGAPPGHSGPTLDEEGIDLQMGNGLTFNQEVHTAAIMSDTLFIITAS
jgi:hypothetical protein